MEQDHRDCLEEITKALTRFQFIEEGIRIYLKSAYLLIAKKTQGQPVTRLSINDLEGKSLGSLLREFKKYNDNDPLMSKVNSLIKDRNNLAHRAYYIMYEHLLEGNDLKIQASEVRKVIEQAEECVEQLQIEIARVELMLKRGPVQ